MSKDNVIAVRVDEDEHEQLRRLAKDDGDRPVSAYVRNVIRAHLKITKPKARVTTYGMR